MQVLLESLVWNFLLISDLNFSAFLVQGISSSQQMLNGKLLLNSTLL